jgi:hypothetical protein
MSAFGPLASALREGRPFLPNFSSLELHNISREGILLKWEEMLAPGSWTSQIVTVRLVFANHAALSEGPNGVHKLFAPFPSLTSLSVVREDRPELLLSASRRASVSKLVHIKVENSACYGVALLSHVTLYNDREEVLRGEVSRLTNVELFNCPNVTVGVIKQLRLLRNVEQLVLHHVGKDEEPAPLSEVPPLPPHPPPPTLVLATEGLRQGPQPVGAEGHAVGEKSSMEEVPVQDATIGELPVPAEPAPPELPQSETPARAVQDEIAPPEEVVLVPETPKEIPATPLLLSPLLQRPQLERPLNLVRRPQRLGCL